MPLISVIIPTCNRIEFALQCVSSILTGTYPNFEILVIDQDASQTLKKKLTQHFQHETRLRYFFLDKSGASRARNFGVEQAKGEIVAFIDDDAMASPNWLSGIGEAFTTIHPSPALLAGRLKPVWLSGRPNWYPKEQEYLLGLYDIGDELRPMPEHDQPIGANMAGLRTVVVELGGFDEQLGPNYFRKNPMITGEEAILGQRAREAGYEIYYQPKAEVFHQIAPIKLTRRYFLRRHFWEGVTISIELSLLGKLEAGKYHHIRYHLTTTVKSLGRFVWPSFKNKYQSPHSVTRMLALSRVAYSLGMIYGLLTLEKSTES